MHETMRRIWLLTATSWRLSPLRCVAALLEPIGLVFGLLNAIWLKLLVDGAIDHDKRSVLVAVIGLVSSVAINNVAQLFGGHAKIVLSEQLGFEFDRQIAATTASLPGLAHHERADYLDRLQLLRDQRGVLGQSLSMLINTANELTIAIATVIIAATADPRLLLLALAGLPAMAAARYRSQWKQDADATSAPYGRLAQQLAGLTTDLAANMEMRVFGIRELIKRRHQDAIADWRRPRTAAEIKSGFLSAGEALIFQATAAGVLTWMLVDAAHHRTSPGTLILAISMFGRLQEAAVTTIWTVTRAGDVLRGAGHLLWLRDYARVGERDYAGQVTPPPTLSQGIKIDHVTFTYDSSVEPSLNDVSVDLPAGAVIAIVGENGAGKSTFVKLLTGLYRPTAGRILIDNIDLDDLDISAWRATGSAAFQDFARFEFTAQHAIGTGDLQRLDDADAVEAAIRRAAATDILPALRYGLQTQLGTSWENGVDISGGQWQKLALARALMRTRPLLLVFDEPTAALDAQAEHSLFERYTATARAAGQRGAITLLITHRFSTVQSADLVLVLHNGRVTEYGTHDDLIAKHGHYAELYNLQAAGYR